MIKTPSVSNQKFAFIGAALCLDFANTVGSRKSSDGGKDKLADYAALLSWSEQAGVLTRAETQRLGRRAIVDPSAADATLSDAGRLREAIYRVFSGAVQRLRANEKDLAILNLALAKALSNSRITWRPGGYMLDWRRDEHALDSMVWPISKSAADLLISGEFDRVSECGDAECGWLFVDGSRNRSRRWCDMRDCGNLAKVRGFRTRIREKHTPMKP